LKELTKLAFNVHPVPDGMTSRTFLALLQYSNVKEMEVRGSLVFGNEDMVMNNLLQKVLDYFELCKAGFGLV
jgi:hypothetical protein